MEWIPVKERLPDGHMEVLVSVGEADPFVETAVFTENVNNYVPKGNKRGFVKDVPSSKWGFEDWTDIVTAWMPRPEAYRERV